MAERKQGLETEKIDEGPTKLQAQIPDGCVCVCVWQRAYTSLHTEQALEGWYDFGPVTPFPAVSGLDPVS